MGNCLCGPQERREEAPPPVKTEDLKHLGPPPSGAPASTEVKFDPELLTQDGEEWRAKAHAHGDKAHQLGQDSKNAYESGDKARAKELSEEAAKERDLMNKAHAKAAEIIFAQKNHERDIWSIDLHLLLVKEALDRTEARLEACKSIAGSKGELCIIFGQGHHSADHVAKIKPAVYDMLKEKGYHFTPDVPNPGCVTVHLGVVVQERGLHMEE